MLHKQKRCFPSKGKTKMPNKNSPEIHDEKAGFMYLCFFYVSVGIHKGEKKCFHMFKGQSHEENEHTEKTFPLEVKCKQAK
jgi:hypothetical protein